MKKIRNIFFLAIGIIFTSILGMGMIFLLADTPHVIGGDEAAFEKEIAFNAPLRFEFSESMNKKSVQENILISPQTPGTFTWQARKTLIFTPETPFTIGDRIQVTIGADAKSILGKKMNTTYSHSFHIVGPPQITFISPIAPHEWEHISRPYHSSTTTPEQDNESSQETQEASSFPQTENQDEQEQNDNNFPILQPGQNITLMFDRPLRALGSPTEKDNNTLSDVSNFLTIKPELPGQFRWLGTSAIEFIPDPTRLPMGNTFTATLKSGTPTADGGTLTRDIVWHFETQEPKVISITPHSNSRFISPKTSVRVEFNQPVEEESFFSHLTVEPDLPEEQVRQIKVEWNREQDPHVMTIHFEPHFAKNEEVTIRISPGVKSLSGTKESTQEFTSVFHTLGDPQIVSISPAPGATIAPSDELVVEFATPMDTEQIKQHLTFTPPIAHEQISVWGSNSHNSETKTYRISAPFDAQTEYTWSISDELSDMRLQRAIQREKDDETGQTSLSDEAKLPEGFSRSFRTGDFASQLTQMTRGSRKGVYDAGAPISLFVQHRNIDEINITVCPLSQQNIVNRELSLSANTKCGSSNSTTWTEEFPGETNQSHVTEIALSERVELSMGTYAYQFSSPQYTNSEGSPVIFSGNISLVTSTLTAKWTDSNALIWATDFGEGQPIEGMEITLFQENNNTAQQVASAVTDAQGIAQFSFPAESGNHYFAIGKKGTEHLSYVGKNWNDGIAPWDFGIDSDWREHPFFRWYVYTDRPIYRPDQTVYFKGIIRNDHDAKLTLPDEDTTVRVTIESPQGTQVMDEEISVTPQGTFFGEFPIAENAELGTYFLQGSVAQSGNEFIRTFSVEHYRKPDFKVDITSMRDAPVGSDQSIIPSHFLGENLETQISGSYYFGGSLSKGAVNYTVVREPYFFHEWDGSEWYSFSTDDDFCWWYCTAEETVVTTGEDILDDDGTHSVSIDTNFEWKEGSSPTSQLLTISATIDDISGRSVSKTETFVLHQANGYVGIRPEQYFLSESDTQIPFSIITVTPEGNIVPDQLVEIELFQLTWNSVQKQGVDGNLYWESVQERIPLDQIQTITGTDGEETAYFLIPPQDERYTGQLEAVATWQDEQGRTATASTTTYRSSSDYISWRQENNDRIDLTLDQTSYDVGDTARLLVSSPFTETVPALLTIERNDILDARIVEVSTGEYVEIPVTPDMLPNAFISLTLVKGKGMLSEIQMLSETTFMIREAAEKMEEKISELEQKLQQTHEDALSDTTGENIRRHNARIKIATQNLQKAKSELQEINTQLKKQEEEYERKIETFCTIHKEENCNAEKIENSLGELDKRSPLQTLNSPPPRPQMKMGMTPLFVNTDQKQLTLSLDTEKDHYLPGDTVKLTVTTTDADGNGVPADISIAVVDQSVLALKSRNLENILEFFWGARSLGVETANTLVYFIERLNVKAQKGEKGGGGGEIADELTRKKRGEFRDTTFWIPDLTTDENGRAEVEIPLADNLTTWEIWAVGATPETIVGAHTQTFIARKPLMIQSALPRFALVGDEFTASFIVHNQSGEDQDLKAQLSTKNFDLTPNNDVGRDEAMPRPSEDSVQSNFLVKNGEKRLVQFSGIVTGESETTLAQFDPIRFTLLVNNADDTMRDELEIFVPIHAPAIGEHIATSGQTSDLHTEYVRIPSSALPNIGHMTISFGTSQIQPFIRGLQSLIAYPYGCAEQIMSKHLSSIVSQRAEESLGVHILDIENSSQVCKFHEEQDCNERMTHDSDEKLYQLSTLKTFNSLISTGLQELSRLQRPDGGFGYWESSQSSAPYLSAYITYGLWQTQQTGFSVDQNILTDAEKYLMAQISQSEQCQHYSKPCIDDETRAFILFVLSEMDTSNLESFLNPLFEIREDLNLSGQIFLLMAMQNMERETWNAQQKQVVETQDLASLPEILLSEIEAQARHTPRGVQFESGNSSPWTMNSDTKTTALALMALSRENANHPLLPKITAHLAQSQQHSSHLGLWGNTHDTAWVIIAYLEYLERANILNPNFTATAQVNGNFVGDATFTPEQIFQTVPVAHIPTDELLKGTQVNEVNMSQDGDGTLFYDLTANYYLPIDQITEHNSGIGIMREYYRLDDAEMNEPVSSAHKGETLRAKLTILVPESRYLVSVSERLPAGLEAVNFELETADKSLLIGDEQNESESYWRWWSNLRHFHHREFRDDEVLLFADVLPQGKYEYHFYVSATTEGVFQHLPAIAEQMYTPEVFGRTNGSTFIVTP